MELARRLHPSMQFEVPKGSTHLIVVNGIQISLQNLKAKFDQSDLAQGTLERLVVEHLQLVIDDEPSVSDFTTARQKLRPQLMPPEYAKQASIISFPFGKTLAVGIVLDSDRSYLYLTQEHAQRWSKSPDELLELSIANLNEASREMQMSSAANEEAKWIAIETKDGFDAVRILIPKFRGFLAERLGSPFRFAIPNRDFLVCWNVGASARFADFTASKIKKDFEAQPYPLSLHIFEVSADGKITELE